MEKYDSPSLEVKEVETPEILNGSSAVTAIDVDIDVSEL